MKNQKRFSKDKQKERGFKIAQEMSKEFPFRYFKAIQLELREYE